MEKINIAELLKDLPSGMELDCTMYEDCKFLDVGVDPDSDYLIRITTPCGVRYLDKYGRYTNDDKAKCVIFPKGKTTWEGFVPPCKFKDGDIIVTTLGHIAIISEHIKKELFHIHVLLISNNLFYNGENTQVVVKRLATEEEKEKLFQEIKSNGYRWNTETKTLEKLIEPKFKIGDKIRHRLTGDVYKILFVLSNGCGGGVYDVAITNEIGKSIDVKEQDDYELVPNKFDITTLKPFESKVLVRGESERPWKPAEFGFFNDGFFYVLGGNAYKQCIPYEGNEHLLGTTDDCDEYFKIWK